MATHACFRSMVRTAPDPDCGRAIAAQLLSSGRPARRQRSRSGDEVPNERRKESPLPALLWWCVLMLAIHALVAWLVWS